MSFCPRQPVGKQVVSDEIDRVERCPPVQPHTIMHRHWWIVFTVLGCCLFSHVLAIMVYSSPLRKFVFTSLCHQNHCMSSGAFKSLGLVQDADIPFLKCFLLYY